jgi:Ca-activated chloride channel family protein
MTDFHFLRPWWLLALLPLAVLVWALHRHRRGGGDWREFCDSALLPHILIGTPGRQARWPLWLTAVGGTLAVLALAGPAWERLPAPVFRNLSALVVVLDLSMSMEAADLKPSRLERARFKIEDILRERKDGQTALVVYARDAFAVTPITDDSATIAAQLAALSPALMPVQGTRPDLGLKTAARLLKQAGLKAGDVLLIGSGEGSGGAESTAAKLRTDGYRVSVLGTGTSDGAPVPLPEGGFLKDMRGSIVIPRLDASALARLAEAGGGLYRTLTPGSGDLDALLRFLDRRAEATEQTGNTVHIEQWRERGVFLLPILLPLAALAFRRGWLGVWLLLALAPVPEPAQAFEWQDLWLTPDQQAQRDFRAGHPDEAAQRFQNPEWKAAAEYKAGQYEQAAKALEKLDTGASQYNRGNALANQGQYEQALEAYDRALKLDPQNEDARHNRKLVEEVLRKQQEERKKQEQEKQQDQQDQGQDQGQPPQPSQSGQKGSEPPEQGKNGDQEPDRQNQEADQSSQQSAESRPDGNRNGETQGAKPDEKSKDSEQSENRPAPGEGEKGEQAAKAEKPEPARQGESPEKKNPAAQGQPEKADGTETRNVAPESKATGETRQAEEQWLRRIPDDPGGLLKRKFYYQYRQRQQKQDAEREPW